jgi:hypothetical protein
MSSPPIAARDLLFEMIKKADADSVFDQLAPFFAVYKAGYLDALIREDTKILDVHREAIFYLKPAWESNIILALIVVASKNPEASFVESLAFYFSLDGKLRKFAQDIFRCQTETCDLLISCLGKLESHLARSMDGDMATTFSQVKDVIEQGRFE